MMSFVLVHDPLYNTTEAEAGLHKKCYQLKPGAYTDSPPL